MIDILLIVAVVFAPLLAVVAVITVRPAGLAAGRLVTLGCAVASLAAFAIIVVSATRPDGLVGYSDGWPLHVDRASSLLLVAVTTTGVVVGSFSRRSIDLDPRGRRFFVLLGALVTGGSLVVVHGSWVALLAGWIGSTWALVALLGHRSELAATKRAQRTIARALMVGDGALVLAIAVVVAIGGADPLTDVVTVAARVGSSAVFGIPAADLVAVLLVVAGASRSALVPWHRWLAATLAAPTPVSALVHAGFVSGAGLLLIRFHALVLNSAVAVYAAFFLAVLTILIAVGAGSARVDVKGKLAWSTVAQMGFMVVQCSVGALSSAVLHIIGHGLYKASMFLGAGDVISAGLRSTRRATPLPVWSAAARATLAIAIATVTLGLGLWVLPPHLSAAGVVLVAVFAWSTVVHGLWGWLSRGALKSSLALLVSLAGALVAVFAYLGGLRFMERFLAPSFGEGPLGDVPLGDVPLGPGVGVTTLVVTIGAVALIVGGVMFTPGSAAQRLRDKISILFARTAHPSVSKVVARRVVRGESALTRSEHARSEHAGSKHAGSEHVGLVAAEGHGRPDVSRSQIHGDVSRATSIIAPTWPLTSFVAVNPLGGLEQLGFDGATKVARQHLRARTHLTLDEYRADHAQALTTADDLAWAIETCFVDVCSTPDISVGGVDVSAADVIRLDMLHGPEGEEAQEPLTALERAQGTASELGKLIDATVCHSVSQFMTNASGSGASDTSFHTQWRTDATRVTNLRLHLGAQALRWLDDLGEDPADMIIAALAVVGVNNRDRVSEMRGHLSRVQGWAGLAKWRTDWAHPNESRAMLAPINIVAARCALEAACMLGRPTASAALTPGHDEDALIEQRVEAILATLPMRASADERLAISHVVRLVDSQARNACWLSAQERGVERDLLSRLDSGDSGDSGDSDALTTARAPAAQLAFCIDVRSEGLRRHLEATGQYDTLGFAGFYGVAMSVQRLGWAHAEARCPVLVTPSVKASEKPSGTPESLADVKRMFARDRVASGATAVHSSAKYGAGAPFAMTEAAGWFAGPVAAARTLLPARLTPRKRPATTMLLDGSDHEGLDNEQRVFTAEAVLRTMGLTDGFAPLVVLCGHASPTVNNPHATSLDCGACAGASGEDSARTVASLINDPRVRSGLRERGIDVPDGTHVVAGLHDTGSDHVEILDAHLIPISHRESITALVTDLEVAGRRQCADRALLLPGRAASVRSRGADWAQIRPEWGLARNTSFIIGPRSTSAGADLEGRAFLHTYDADVDPDGSVLETIMTAPLVVAHWISAQYYFSTVDPDKFGAGDKLLHNIVGDTGVIQGEHGDLRVGLPFQSTHCGDRRHHQPVRLLAVIEAPLERIERIIGDNPILKTLVGGSWIRIAGRSHPNEPWSIRSAKGTWSAEPKATNTIPVLETS